uniref:Peptide chain release factor N(5)-glutamine methyltransferase n=1 Tax=Chromera velia CCMP2878 TaxID=1169474 RepID=A0A0G4FSW8_9ALVE|eukprot:Cvel_3683.t1-p1 / transcript=Cvel_3683.t1 / gene=Cvel_3683 / organism=Chromera_velia_CCMP2878 / gene_product=HemK methyltransferase family member 1, putative / transcript_product=HemK methyltransferase family member 1, putative / location=Cvel_scaffold153:23028-27060(-) / protein_length=439 / sequence_SO=supercontig / SO=protein_coding / is_pseudo=false
MGISLQPPSSAFAFLRSSGVVKIGTPSASMHFFSLRSLNPSISQHLRSSLHTASAVLREEGDGDGGDGTVTVETVLQNAISEFKRRDVEEPELSAQWLMAKILDCGYSLSAVRSHGRRRLSLAESSAFYELCQRRNRHEPIQYIVGEWDFFNLQLSLRPPVLIPRPETEELVELFLARCKVAIAELREGGSRRRLRILDIGAGTGAIGLALAQSLGDSCHVDAIDISPEAVALAKENAKACLGPSRVKLKEEFPSREGGLNGEEEVFESSDGGTYRVGLASVLLFPQALSRSEEAELPWGNYDLIVSNPPYIPSADLDGLHEQVTDFEDLLALDGGTEGLRVIWEILAVSPLVLSSSSSGGCREVWMEVDASHPEALQAVLGGNSDGGGGEMKRSGGGSSSLLLQSVPSEVSRRGVRLKRWMKDLSGNPRFVVFSIPDR